MRGWLDRLLFVVEWNKGVPGIPYLSLDRTPARAPVSVGGRESHKS